MSPGWCDRGGMEVGFDRGWYEDGVSAADEDDALNGAFCAVLADAILG